MEVSGSRVLITGASRGIGGALAEAFAGAGAKVALVARTESAIKDLATRLGGTAHPADLSTADGRRGLIARVEADGGPIDILVNNAGVDFTKAFVDFTEDEIQQLAEVNFIAPIELSRQATPGFIARNRGWIVNVSSLAGAAAYPGLVAYSASKSGLTHFSAGLRWELDGTGVGVTSVEIGPVDTGMWDHLETYEPIKAMTDRLFKLHLTKKLSVDKVANATLKAVKNGKPYVWLPKRDLAFYALANAPRQIARRVIHAGQSPR